MNCCICDEGYRLGYYVFDGFSLCPTCFERIQTQHLISVNVPNGPKTTLEMILSHREQHGNETVRYRIFREDEGRV